MAAFEATLIAGSFVLGLSHALEVDHMTAVSAFVATKPRPREAAVFGAKWALGHGISLLIFGSVLYALKLVIAPSLAAIFERAVGVALLFLGAWTLYRLRGNLPAHSHRHSHHYGRAPILMGVLHGIAGTAAFAGQAIVVASRSFLFVVFYTMVFSLGVLVSMSAFSGVLGLVVRRAGRALQIAMGLWACVVGFVLMLGLF